MDFIARAAS